MNGASCGTAYSQQSKAVAAGLEVLSKHEEVFTARPRILVPVTELATLHACIGALGVGRAALRNLPQQRPLLVEGQTGVLFQRHPCHCFKLVLLQSQLVLPRLCPAAERDWRHDTAISTAGPGTSLVWQHMAACHVICWLCSINSIGAHPDISNAFLSQRSNVVLRLLDACRMPAYAMDMPAHLKAITKKKSDLPKAKPCA